VVGPRDLHGLSVSEVAMSIALPVRRHHPDDPGAFGHQSARGINSVPLVHGNGCPCVEGHGRAQGPPEHDARDVVEAKLEDLMQQRPKTRVIRAGPGAVLVYPPAGDR
jgi:hypothetical protein